VSSGRVADFDHPVIRLVTSPVWRCRSTQARAIKPRRGAAGSADLRPKIGRQAARAPREAEAFVIGPREWLPAAGSGQRHASAENPISIGGDFRLIYRLTHEP
jgi:hypothetical protein